MSTKALNLELVSPEKLLFSDEVEMAVIPGQEGDFGVMAGHSPFLSSLRPGVIYIFDNNQVSKKIFISGGFADVQSSTCTILADQVVDVTDLKSDEIKQKISDLKEDIADEKDSFALDQLKAKLSVYTAQEQALNKPSYS